LAIATFGSELAEFIRELLVDRGELVLLGLGQIEIAGNVGILKGLRARGLNGNLTKAGLLRSIQNLGELAAELVIHALRDAGNFGPHLAVPLLMIFARLIPIAARSATGRVELLRPLFVNFSDELLYLVGLFRRESEFFLNRLVSEDKQRCDAVRHSASARAVMATLRLNRGDIHRRDQ
jgi:hypothetical protein